MKVLIAGLDATTITFLRSKGIGVEIEGIEDAADLESWLVDGLFDAGIIDLDKSKLGIYAARGLRARKIETPIIGISNGPGDRTWAEHRAMFLENGGDDLLRGPVNPRELCATLGAVTRRFKGAMFDILELKSGSAVMKINLTTRSVSLDDKVVQLTGKERDIMLFLASGPGRVMTKESILTDIYCGQDEPELKIIDVFVCKARKKLADINPDAGAFIETVWGRGYRFRSQEDMLPGENKSA